MIRATGIILIFLAHLSSSQYGQAGKGTDWAHTSVLVDSGIYAVLWHPLYLGWLLMYVAAILFSQHWLTAIIGILGMACVYSISRQEGRHLIEKFDDVYERYMQSVPAMNLLAGVMWMLRREKR
jgi:protein-S-isoprenylcysteine O-methyltransferase Ste14